MGEWKRAGYGWREWTWHKIIWRHTEPKNSIITQATWISAALTHFCLIVFIAGMTVYTLHQSLSRTILVDETCPSPIFANVHLIYTFYVFLNPNWQKRTQFCNHLGDISYSCWVIAKRGQISIILKVKIQKFWKPRWWFLLISFFVRNSNEI